MKQFFITLITTASGVSSKRFAGLFLIMGSFVIKLLCVIFAVIWNYQFSDAVYETMTSSQLIGAGLLGVGLFDKSFKINNNEEGLSKKTN